MKRVSIWIFLIIVSASIGFAAGSRSNRPRVILNQALVNTLFKEAVTPPPDPQCLQGKKYQQIKCRFDEYEKTDETIHREDWKIYGQDSGGQPVTIHYNTLSDGVTVVCKKKRCK